MNFGELSKEQKQYVILGVIVGLAMLFGVANFVLMPMKNRYATAKRELDALSAELDAAHRVIHSEDKIRENLANSEAVLREAAQQFLPDADNPLSWATQKIYHLARETGVEVSSVSEIGGSTVLQTQTQDEQARRAFGSYAVRILTECSYDQLKVLVRALAEGNPYLSVTGISMDARPGNPLKHGLQIVVEWPILRNAEAAARILK